MGRLYMGSLTFEQWVEQFKPVDKKTGEIFTGHLLMDSCLWDTYDDMTQLRRFVEEGIINRFHGWTVYSRPKSKLILSQGLYSVNAIGYILTAKSHEDFDIGDIVF